MGRYDRSSLVVGRFQPLHEGHMHIIRKCAEDSDHIIVGIGSAQYSNTLENPFTAGERYMMINKALREEEITDYSIVPIQDINMSDKWVDHVVSMVPPFRKVYTTNPTTKILFEEAGFEVVVPPLYERDLYSGTEIRRRMASDGDWRSMVPPSVSCVIEDIDGVERVKKTSKGFNSSQSDAGVLLKLLRDKGCTMSAAESCTGGMIGELITDVPGSSESFLGSAVTYSNDAKERILGVNHDTLERFGAVSEETAREMALGTEKAYGSDYAVAVTGIAGPGGGTPAKPVGLVYIAVADGPRTVVTRNLFQGDRTQIRESTAREALTLLVQMVEGLL